MIKTKRQYLKDGDRVFAECELRYDEEKNGFYLDTGGEITAAWFDGIDMDFDEKGRPYIDREVK